MVSIKDGGTDGRGLASESLEGHTEGTILDRVDYIRLELLAGAIFADSRRLFVDDGSSDGSRRPKSRELS